MKIEYILNILRKLWKNVYTRHIIYWISAYLILFSVNYSTIWSSQKNEAHIAYYYTTSYILISIFPVVTHLLVLDKFYLRQKYFLYIISLILILFISYSLTQLIQPLIDDVFNLQDFKEIYGVYWGFEIPIYAIILTSGLKYYFKIISSKKRSLDIKYEQLQIEISMLRSHINPHFFFNTLNNLYALSLDRSDKLPDFVHKFLDLLKYIDDQSKKDKVFITEEIKLIKNYIDLQKLRLSTYIDIKLYTTGKLIGVMIEPMLLLLFVENSFKHGLSGLTESGFININLNRIENAIYFSVENSKSASSQNLLKSNSGIGLGNVKKRLDLLYKEKYDLEISDTKSTFRIRLKLIHEN